MFIYVVVGALFDEYSFSPDASLPLIFGWFVFTALALALAMPATFVVAAGVAVHHGVRGLDGGGGEASAELPGRLSQDGARIRAHQVAGPGSVNPGGAL